MINELTLVGYVGQDPNYVSGASDYSRATFSIATNKSYTKKDGSYVETTFWHDCTAWGPVADRISKMVKKGSLLMLRGELTYWEQEKEGFGKVKRATVKVDFFHVLKDPLGSVREQEQVNTYTGQVSLPNNEISGGSGAPFEPDDLPF